MPALERHLQEESPTTWFLRGCYNELRWRLGLMQNQHVLLGPGGWMYYRTTLQLDAVTVRAKLVQKAAIVKPLKAEADALGVRVCVVVVPDKERIYPEFAYPEGRMPPARAAFYGEILAALR